VLMCAGTAGQLWLIRLCLLEKCSGALAAYGFAGASLNLSMDVALRELGSSRPTERGSAVQTG
jgi:hypothetical protein